MDEMITQNEIVQLSNDLEISEREARFMLSIEAGEIDGDIVSGPPYDYVVKEQSGTSAVPSSLTRASKKRAVGSAGHSHGTAPLPRQPLAQTPVLEEAKTK